MGISTNKHTLLPNDAVLQQMKNLRHLPDQNLNFGGARRVTTEKALKDIYSVKMQRKEYIHSSSKAKKQNILLLTLSIYACTTSKKTIITSTCQYFKQIHTTTFTILE